MYVDLTTEFRHLVSDMRDRSDELGLVIPVRDKTRILGTRSSVARQVDTVVTTVRSLAELLATHKRAYLETMSVSGAMSDTERNQVIIV